MVRCELHLLLDRRGGVYLFVCVCVCGFVGMGVGMGLGVSAGVCGGLGEVVHTSLSQFPGKESKTGVGNSQHLSRNSYNDGTLHKTEQVAFDKDLHRP